MREPIVLESNQEHATIRTDGICTTLVAGMGMGGGWVPMIVEVKDDKDTDGEKILPLGRG